MNEIVYADECTPLIEEHRTKTWEYFYCTSGKGELVAENQSLSYQEGTVICIPPECKMENRLGDAGKGYLLRIADATFPRKIEPVSFEDPSDGFLLSAFMAACAYFKKEQGRERRILLTAYAFLIISHIEAGLENRSKSETVEKILEDINRNYSDCNYELEKYLSSFLFSEDYIRKRFKAEVGVTPHQYLTELRLEQAAERLWYKRNISNNITEISRLCGFREPLYFSKVFKKRYGVSPRQYVEAQKGEKD
ncbi:MAG: helix-turn-helix domain-containing protein [Clostridia bacterium]|nr:helix-turn-helix domain-containing protein [Clostridia bacterium]